MLKPSEREKLQDCLMLVQSARSILSEIERAIVPDIADIESCFRKADQTITELLRA